METATMGNCEPAAQPKGCGSVTLRLTLHAPFFYSTVRMWEQRFRSLATSLPLLRGCGADEESAASRPLLRIHSTHSKQDGREGVDLYHGQRVVHFP